MTNKIFSIGQVFDDTYPPEAAVWCNQNGAYIEETSRGTYVIKKVPEPTQEEIEVEELNKYIEELEGTVDTLCKRLQVAQLSGNTEEINKIKNEYKELTNGN